MADRYYIHGDERDDGTIYCKRCDAFVSMGHFYESDHVDAKRPHQRIVTDYERATRDLKAVSRKEIRERCPRPKDARNVFL